MSISISKGKINYCLGTYVRGIIMNKMKKKVFIGTAIVLGLCIGGGLVFWYNKTQTIKSALGDQSNIIQEKLVVWDDPAGFTFQYPEGVSIDKHDEDKDNYAHVEITNSSHPGSIIVWAKDTTAGDVTAWVRTEQQFSGANSIDTTLGNIAAKKILISTPKEKLFVGTIYDDLLFLVDASLDDKDYWLKTTQTIVDSFVFKPVIDATSSMTDQGDSDGDSQGAVDEEEVVQ